MTTSSDDDGLVVPLELEDLDVGVGPGEREGEGIVWETWLSIRAKGCVDRSMAGWYLLTYLRIPSDEGGGLIMSGRIQGVSFAHRLKLLRDASSALTEMDREDADLDKLGGGYCLRNILSTSICKSAVVRRWRGWSVSLEAVV